MHNNRMPSVFKFCFSTKVTKTKAENIRERDGREALRKNQKFDNSIINSDDDDIYFGGLGVGGDTVEDGYNVPLLALPPSDYHIARCFCQIISPPLPTIWKRYAGGRILFGMMLSVKTLKTPMDTTKLLAAIRYLVMRILG